MDRLIEDYNAGTSVVDLAKKYGIHRATVSAHLSRRSTTRRRPGLDVDECVEAVRLFRAGVSMRAIARRLAVGRRSVRTCLVEAGLVDADPSGLRTSSEVAGGGTQLKAAS